MKKFIFFMLTISLGIIAFGQEEEQLPPSPGEKNNEYRTIFGNESSNGAYGGISLQYTRIDQKDAFIGSMRGAWIINHRLGLGFSGTGFINDYHYDYNASRDVNLSGGYGGILVEPVLLPNFPAHLSIPLVFGMGAATYVYYDPFYNWNDYMNQTDVFTVFEPGIEFELNISRFFRFAVGAYYRLTSDIDLPATSPDVLNGLSGGITLKFGKF